MGCPNKKNKGNKECCGLTSKFRADWRYCGEELECLGVKRGDTLGVILEKINSVSCEGGSTYSFEENEECENGGFDIFKGEEKIFSQCYPCCGDSCRGLHVSDYSKEKVEDESHLSHIHNIEVEGGSGDYEFSVTPMVFYSFFGTLYEININTETGELVVKMTKTDDGLLSELTGMFNITIKDKVTGCIIQYSIFEVMFGQGS